MRSPAVKKALVVVVLIAVANVVWNWTTTFDRPQ
jgi:hypothetical protein